MAKLMSFEKLQAKFDKLQLDEAARKYVTRQYDRTLDFIESAEDGDRRWDPEIYIGPGGRMALDTTYNDVWDDVERLVGPKRVKKVFEAFFSE